MIREDLIALQDQVSEARDFLVVVVMACGSRRFAGAESTALCTVGDAARDKLEAIGATLDRLARGLSTSELPGQG